MTLLAGAAGVAGAALGGLVGVAARATGRRPLHPRGAELRGELRLGDDARAPGAVEPYRDRAVVRVSRAAGLPWPWPDVHGLALRWERGGRAESLLLSGTGRGPVGRFVLRPRRDVARGVLTTLMPFRSPAGPVVVAALPRRRGDGGLDVLLVSARPFGRWHRWRFLRVDAPVGALEDGDTRFDPVLDCPVGLATYAWAAALRLPAYRRARTVAPAPRPLPW